MSFGKFTGNLPTVETVGKGKDRQKLERSQTINVGPSDATFQLDVTVGLTASPRKGHTGKFEPGTRGSVKVSNRRFPAVNADVVAYVLAAFGGPSYDDIRAMLPIIDRAVAQLTDADAADTAEALRTAWQHIAGHHAYTSVAHYASTLAALEGQVIAAHDESKTRHGGETKAYHEWLAGFEYNRG